MRQRVGTGRNGVTHEREQSRGKMDLRQPAFLFLKAVLVFPGRGGRRLGLDWPDEHPGDGFAPRHR